MPGSCREKLDSFAFQRAHRSAPHAHHGCAALSSDRTTTGRTGQLNYRNHVKRAICACLAASLRLSLASGQADTHDSQLPEISITAHRLQEALKRVIPGFVRSHGVPSSKISQVSLWLDPVCPMTLGLNPASNEFISRRIVDIATSV